MRMLEEALQVLGNDMCGKMLEKIASLSEEDQEKFLDDFARNPYSAIAKSGALMEIEYEEHRNSPETIARVEAMMEAAEFEDPFSEFVEEFNLNEEDGNDEGNGSLQ